MKPRANARADISTWMDRRRETFMPKPPTLSQMQQKHSQHYIKLHVIHRSRQEWASGKYLSYFSSKTWYTLKKHLTEALLTSNHVFMEK